MLGVIPRTFEKLGIELEYNGDDIRIPPQEHYEVQNFLDGGGTYDLRCSMARLHA